MAKVISLSNKAYLMLKEAKREGESFSDLALRLLHETEQKPLMDFFGKWPGPKEELDTMERMIEEGRKKAKLREVTF